VARQLRKIFRLSIAIALSITTAEVYAAPGQFEITPYGAFSFGGTFNDADGEISASLDDSESFGLLLNFREASNTQWEILYSRQSTIAGIDQLQGSDINVDLDIHYLQGGGTYQGDGDKVRPYLAATIGVAHIDVKSSGFDSDSFFSFSLGPGLQIFPHERFGIRLEARFFGTLVRSGSNLFCVSDPGNAMAGCALTVNGEVMWQTHVMAGVVFRF
jgi:hypothetical protein